MTVDKNGVDYIGINVRKEGTNIAPTVYINGMFNSGVSVADAAAEVMKIMAAEYAKIGSEHMDTAWIRDFDLVKPHLAARLLNKANVPGDVATLDAKPYGFDDLVLVPVIKCDIQGMNGTITVKESFLRHWDISSEELRDSVVNGLAEPVVKNFLQFMGLHEPSGDETPLVVFITSEDGAAGVIKARKKLEKIFPEGYRVLPVSVHEVLAVSVYSDEGHLNAMVESVNKDELPKEDFLSDHVYTF